MRLVTLFMSSFDCIRLGNSTNDGGTEGRRDRYDNHEGARTSVECDTDD